MWSAKASGGDNGTRMWLPEVHGGFAASRRRGLPRAGVRRRSLARAGGRPGAGDGGEAADPAGQELGKEGRRWIRPAGRRSATRRGGAARRGAGAARDRGDQVDTVETSRIGWDPVGR